MAERWRTFPVRLGLVTAVALAVRLAYAVGVRGDDPAGSDGFYFHHQANAISQGDGFINPVIWLNAGVELQAAHHPPLYSLYLALASVVGIDTPLGHRVVSCLAGAATVALIGVVAHRLAGGGERGQRAGLLAAGIGAVYPILWVNDGLLLSEPLYGVMICLMLLAAYRVYDEPTPARMAVLGAAIALAALTRAEASNLLLFLVVPMALLLPSLGWRRRVALVVVAGVAYATVVSPWVLYNFARFDEPVALSYGAAGVLPQANCDQTYDGALLGYWSGQCAFPSEREIPELRKPRPDPVVSAQQAVDYLGDDDESTAANVGLERGLDYIESRPGRAVVVGAARVGRLWGVYRPGQGIELDTVIEGRGRGISTVGLVLYYELLALAVGGLVVLRRRTVPILPFVSLAVLATATAFIAIGITRYRYPVDVGLVILAGVALDAAWHWVRAPRRKTPSARPSPPARTEVPA